LRSNNVNDVIVALGDVRHHQLRPQTSDNPTSSSLEHSYFRPIDCCPTPASPIPRPTQYKKNNHSSILNVTFLSTYEIYYATLNQFLGFAVPWLAGLSLSLHPIKGACTGKRLGAQRKSMALSIFVSSSFFS
jgi:hypothetical protein